MSAGPLGINCAANAPTYIIVKGLGLAAVVTGLSSLGGGAVQVPKYTANSKYTRPPF